MKLYLQRNSEIPLYQQIADQIRERVRSGALPPGTRLPPVRQLANELGLTRLTVHTAYAELQAEGIIESFVGRGSFVASQSGTATAPPADAGARAQPPAAWASQSLLADMQRMALQPNLRSFAQAIPAPETYPVHEFRRALSMALNDPAALGYRPTQGEAILREQVSRLLLDRGINAAPDLVLIAAGAQQGIDLALRAFAEPGDIVLAEEPTYPGFIELAAQRGQRIVGLPIDEYGLRVDALEAACEAYRPRLLYTVATFHNPTGVLLSAERRQALLRIARAYNVLVVEDDAYGLLSYDNSPPPALKASDTAGHVIFITSFSKVLMPSLRLGAVVAAADQLPALLAAKRSSDLVCSPLLQRALAEYLRRPGIEGHLQQVRLLYAERRDAMLAALEHHLPECHWSYPAGGLCLWLALPEGIDERDFYLDAIERGVGVAPGRAFFSQPQHDAFIRLSFGAHPPQVIEESVAQLGSLLREHLRRPALLAARACRESGPLV
ncbi:MAG: GntR family transcriptional regulator [Herpetosiphonaceae bacterium]|nr:MAG: GntR family transcriptional regulator [Herpetosiphonaceae bacterium]